jgi:alpha-tubulin suppressor-like RCC1 family protein
MLFALVVFACSLATVASIDIISASSNSVYAGVSTQLQLHVNLSDFSIPLIAEVAIGSYHACARTSAGALHCWGRGQLGQVGNGKSDNTNSRPKLVLSGRVTTVSAGGLHSCFLNLDGAAFCFGYNIVGQLGDGTKTNRNTPVPVLGLQANVTAIECGFYHTCAVNSSGNVLCWGYNADGQLGDGSVTSRSTPTNVAGLPPIAVVSLGSFHSCALGIAPKNNVYCWGSNTFGQCGNTSTVRILLPAQVVGLGPVALFAVGGAHSCAGDATVLYCWGNNIAGQVGDGTFQNRALPTALQQSDIGPIRTLSLGDLHSCAINEEGLLWCWGRTSLMTIDADTSQTSSYYSSLLEPGNASVASVPLPSKAKYLACGDKNTCVVSINGSLLCWGANSNGQLGDGTTRDSLLPILAFESCSGPAVGTSISGLSCDWTGSSFLLRIHASSLIASTVSQSISFFFRPP